MPLRRLAAFTAAASLAAAPVVAQAKPAPIQPAEETVQGSALRSGSAVFILPLLVVIALLLAMTSDHDDTPASP